MHILVIIKRHNTCFYFIFLKKIQSNACGSNVQITKSCALSAVPHPVEIRKRKQLVARGDRSRKKKEAKIPFTIIFFSFDTIDTKLHYSQLQSLHGTTLGYNREAVVAV